MTLSNNEMEFRQKVWDALSNFYLDTELTKDDYDVIAEALINSNLSIEQLKEIDKYEVYPTLQFNLLSPAGEWAGFDRAWLNDQCHKNMKGKDSRVRRVVIDCTNRLFYWMRSKHWEELEIRMKSTAQL